MEWESSSNKCDPTGLCGSNAYCIVVDQVRKCVCPPGFDFIDQNQIRVSGASKIPVQIPCLELQKISSLGNDELFGDVILRAFTCDELQKATNNSKDEIGKEGFEFLFKSEQKPSWEARVEIALNIARGILLIFFFFSISVYKKVPTTNNPRLKLEIRGTGGYVAPEWHTNLPITVKVDVYSFGIMLLEIICCRRNVDLDAPDNEVVLASWDVSDKENEGIFKDVTLRSFTYEELERAIDDFNEKLGREAFGSV
ncbi:G-type lectin S-receptor-like serine/threonine-protein kinase At5g24080 [Jatropha curcas]|uniref:G-type lectin S-receptor-like serine/threonine-protein kinase At5g24080 n=1 Tax=Jatropha curcas TaxID=180498 RepID=UPI0009D71608|nr:G-type lectin S-receptor-like serine/threonine-protein kinase At5g24080 [Jatropha curcas]